MNYASTFEKLISEYPKPGSSKVEQCCNKIYKNTTYVSFEEMLEKEKSTL